MSRRCFVIQLDSDTLKKYNVDGPRYTSYPTAPNWNTQFLDSQYRAALTRVGKTSQPLSLYIHIPFCQKRCYYCACNVVIRKNNKESDTYLSYLKKELSLIYQSLGRKVCVEQIHIGGGTPTFLTDSQISYLKTILLEYFDLASVQEMSIELDPRTVTQDRIKRLREIGFNRISFGIQDLDSTVQDSVNRVHPIEQIVPLFRTAQSCNFSSINTDLIYGLPHQTEASFAQTVDRIIQLKPDRIALYSFAHVPWIHPHQNLIKSEHLPTPDQKISLFLLAQKRLIESGYQAIAMDHFALKEDPLAIAFNTGTLTRNFMGYTTLSTKIYLGIGVSSIGYLDDSFCQNTKSLKAYYSDLDNNILPVERGMQLNSDDLIRQYVIASLMCHFVLDKHEFDRRFGVAFDQYFEKEIDFLHSDGLSELVQVSDEKITVTELGRLFVRNICMGFDAYYQPVSNRYSKVI